MNTNVAVIVSRCMRVGDNYFTYGERLVDVRCPTLEEARALGEEKRATGMSVIVRPNYNEIDSEGRFFREWRSFNGEAFKECRWSF